MVNPVVQALTKDGLALPIVDVTHPAFRLELTSAELAKLVADYEAQHDRMKWLPRCIHEALIRVIARRSVLARGIRAARGSYLGGLPTYLLKLGSDNLGPWATPIDRRLADSLVAISVRIRLQDMAELMANVVRKILCDSDRTVCFINLGGGTAIDSLNALLILARDAPELLERRMVIDVLDWDDAGPAFGDRALRALQAPGAPLHNRSLDFRITNWDWTRGQLLTEALATYRRDNAVIFASSEGGVFEYADDATIVDVLGRLRTGGVVAVVGSVTRDDGPIHRLHRDGGGTAICRGLPRFERLTTRAGWNIDTAIERVFSDHVLLVQ